ncbi:hypothetical protein ASPZODRAFT_130735 [Penicilliopsis zonata CBS 506.65]|uniref:tRNA (guanine(9)-N1)-methyltransferase n=1 Tax=Penicilliopsis zonata CBS 506.65 TaxID=1073090 RepID=A0A1L9SN73_9EURO|nr:hypothetical protein ASPZODRAFT_130735 [Penicilliopsis zonata CBS 506.65]OJJ48638.1 hypothetical protein ASPZODRAFT_130735 [Penicilliopsis zonata CBS 506.65]
MEEEEGRPRKLAKLDHSGGQLDGEPVMSGALATNDQGAEDDTARPSAAPDATEDANGKSDEGPGAEEGDETEPKLSKSQLKKLRRRENWEAGREDRKVKRREKLHAKRQRQRAERDAAGATEITLRKDKEKAMQRQRSVLLPITMVIDCGFDDLMLEKERISLGSQLTRSYSDNIKAPYRSHLVISNFDKKLKERFDNLLRKVHEKWRGVHFMQEDFVHASELAKEWMAGPEGGQMVGALADKTDARPEDGEVVYLSSESEHTLMELKPYSTYIIGGLVDKNRHKGICYKRAVELGIKTAKLPIGEYIQMSHRAVLATNHVVEIMLRWMELGDWGEAFMKVIPQRKGGVLKGQGADGDDGEEYDDQEEQEEEDAEVSQDITNDDPSADTNESQEA